MNWGLAPHSLFSASANLYKRCEEIARSKNVLLTTHLAESHDEMEMFRNGRGPLFDFLSGLGRDNSDLHGATPVTHACETCEFDDRWLLVHVNEIVMDDLERLLRPKKSPHIVQCPRSREYFGHSPFKYGKFQKLGFHVTIGKDSLASRRFEPLRRNTGLFARLRSLREILEMTTNPARAKKKKRLGKFARASGR
jgi:cytosine/adenosine deaminase-related metal-dependent hydrolase